MDFSSTSTDFIAHLRTLRFVHANLHAFKLTSVTFELLHHGVEELGCFKFVFGGSAAAT